MSKLWKLAGAFILFMVGGASVFAASPAIVRGTVTNEQGNVVSGALVTLTNSMSQKAITATTGQDGSYSVSISNPDGYTLIITKDGFQAFSESLELHSGQMVDADAKLLVQVAQQTVTVHGDLDGVTTQPSQEKVFESAQSIRVIDRQQMDMVGPVAGGAQVISTAPGAIVTGYGDTGATKYTITLNGLNQGWGGYGGYTGGAALGVTFDGIPVVDPGTDLWPSATLPENGLIQNTNVTYGPGNPADRWYTNIGGSIEFTPLQPTATLHGTVITTYGSYQQKDVVASGSTGLYHGWSAVVSGGTGSGNDFRVAPDGFANPSKDWAVQAKALKTFQGSSLELGGYYSYAGGYRSQVIPVAANPYVTIDGTLGSQQYSQPTSGEYSTLAYNIYNKYDVNQMGLIYGRENVELDNTTTVQNTSWYMHIARLHNRLNDAYQDLSGSTGNQQQNEYNNPYSDTIGDKLLITKRLPWNTVSGGGYFIHDLYNSRNNFYGPAWGGSKTTANVGGNIRSSYFNTNDFSLFLQDDIHPVAALHIMPGIRYVGFATGFYSAVQQDFNLAPNPTPQTSGLNYTTTLSTHCRYIPGSGYSANNPNPTVDPSAYVGVQDACPAANENRSGIEPSVDATVNVRPWLNLYGGFYEALRTPELGGGGGMFQAVDPVSYHLERGTYYQGGFKIHTEGTGFRNNFIFGAAYYHQQFANQEIDTTLANGDTFDANGTSNYNGVNMFADDDPIQNLHLFANANIEAASYSSYITGGLFVNGAATCTNPNGTPVAGCLNYNGYPVSYVPTSTLNAGGIYTTHIAKRFTVEPTASFQFIGSQHLFDNCAEVSGACTSPAPSKTVTMPAYATLNLGAEVPYKLLDFKFMALNVFNTAYNEFEYISAGSYFNTSATAPAGSQYAYNYVTAYPGAPVTAYGSVSVHF